MKNHQFSDVQVSMVSFVPRKVSLLLGAAAVCFFTSFSSASAQSTQYWDTNTGSGTWDTSTVWSASASGGGDTTFTSGNNAIFSSSAVTLTGVTTVSLTNNNVSANSVAFNAGNSGGYTFTGNRVLTLGNGSISTPNTIISLAAGTGLVTFNNNVALNISGASSTVAPGYTLVNNSSNSLVFNGSVNAALNNQGNQATETPVLTISGSGGVTFNGVLSGNDSASQGNGGAVGVALTGTGAVNFNANNGAAGVLSVGSTSTLNANSNFGLQGFNLNTTSVGGTTNLNNTQEVIGGLSGSGNLVLSTSGGQAVTITLQGLGSGNGLIQGANNPTYSGNLSGLGGLIYNGSSNNHNTNGTVAFTGNLTFSGGVTVSDLGTTYGNENLSGGTNGASTLVLQGTDTYGGATVVSNLGVLTINGANGTISNTPSVSVLTGAILNDGDSTAGNGKANRINTAAGLTLSGGSTFNILLGSTTANSQSLASLTVGLGTNTIGTSGSGGGAATLTFTGANPYTRNAGGFLVIPGSGLTTSFTNAPSGAGNVAGGLLEGAVLGNTSFVLAQSGNVTAPTTSGAFGAGNNTSVAASGTAASTTTNSILFNSGSSTVTLAGATTVQSGGIMVGSGATSGTLTGSSLMTGLSGGDLWVYAANGKTLNIASTIADNNTSSLTTGGTGTVTLTGANAYAGATTVASGTLMVGNNTSTGDLGSTSSVTVASGANLTFNHSNSFSFTADPISLAATTGTTTLTQAGTGALTLGSVTGNTAVEVVNGFGTATFYNALNSSTSVGGIDGVDNITRNAGAGALTLGSITGIYTLADNSVTPLNGGTSITEAGQFNTIGQITGSSTAGIGATTTISLNGANTSTTYILHALSNGSMAYNFNSGTWLPGQGLNVGNTSSNNTSNGVFTSATTQSGGTVINNNGDVIGDNTSGTVASYTQSGGTLLFDNTGQVLKIDSATGTTGSSTFTLSGGTLLDANTIQGVNGTGAVQNFVFTGGTLATKAIDMTNLTTSGAVTASLGTLANSGTGNLAPGNIGVTGVTAITGNYSQASNATLAIDLGGTSASSSFQNAGLGNFDKVTVTGTSNLNGNLAIDILPGYTPGANTFAVLASTGAITGSGGAFNSTTPQTVATNEGFSTMTVTTGASSVTLGGYAIVNQWKGASSIWGSTGTSAWTSTGTVYDPNTSLQGAYFANTGGAVTLNQNRTVENVTFNNSAAPFSLSASGGAVLTLSGGNPSAVAEINDLAGSSTISAPITLATNAVVGAASSTTLTLSGGISESPAGQNLTVNGSGTVILSGASSYTGNTTVAGGILGLANNSALGSGASTSTSYVTVLNGATLQLQNYTAPTTAIPLFLYGGSGASGTAGALDNLSGNNTYTGQILLLQGNSVTIGAEAGTLTLASSAPIESQYNSGSSLTFNPTGTSNIVVNSVIDDLGNNTLTKNGTGTLTLNGANSYEANTSLTNGTTLVGISNSTTISGVPTGALGNSAYTVTIGSGTNSVSLLTNGAYNLANDLTIGGTVGSSTVTIGGNTATSSSFGGLTLLDNNLTVTQVAGGTLALNGAFFSGATGTQTLTFNNAGTVNENGVIGGGSGVIAVSQTGVGTTTLNTANTYSGGTSISAGTLVMANAAALGASNSSLALSGTGTLDLKTYSPSFSGISGTGGFITTSAAGSTPTVTVNSSATNTSAAAISNGSGTVSFVKNGTGTQTLTGASTYTGTTLINAGVLAIGNPGSLGATAVTVGNGISGNATLQANGNTSIGTLAGTTGVTVSGGTNTTGQGIVSLQDNSINTLSIQAASGTTSLTLNNGSVLSFDINASQADQILLSASDLASAAGSTTVNINILLRPTTSQTFNLISAPGGGLTNGGTNFVLGATTGAPTFGITLSLNETATTLQLVETANAAPTIAYYSGNVSTGAGTSWSSTTAAGTYQTNFTTDSAGTTNVGALPGPATTVHFYTTNANTNNLATTLDAAYSINALVLDGGSLSHAVGIASGTGGTASTLTIANGITVNSGAGALTISAPVILGGAQSWTNNSANLMTVSGAVTNGSNTLTVTGSGAILISGAIGSGSGGLTDTDTGTVTLTGANNYTGTTTVSAGTLQLGDGTTGHDATIASSSIVDNAALIFSTKSAQSVAGSISGSGSLTENGTGTLTLTGTNSYQGATAVSSGTLQIGNGTTTGNIGNNSGVTLGSGGNLTFSRTDGYSYSGPISTTATTGTETITNATGAGALTLGTVTGASTSNLIIANNSTTGAISITQTGTGNTIGAIQGVSGSSVNLAGTGTTTILDANSLSSIGQTVSFNSGTWTLAGNGYYSSSIVIAGASVSTLAGSGQNFYGVASLNVSSGSLNLQNQYGLRIGNLFGANQNSGNNFTASQTGGTVTVSQNNLELGSSTVGDGGSYNLSGGTLNVTNGNNLNIGAATTGGVATAFNLSGTGTLNVSGTIAGDQGSGAIQNFTFTGGILSANAINMTKLTTSGATTGTVSTLTNAGGILAPGTVGVAGETTITGNYSVTSSSAALAIDLGANTTQGSAYQTGTYDFLNITGTATLGGNLNLSYLTGFAPATAGTAYTVVKTGVGVNSLTGTFAIANGNIGKAGGSAIIDDGTGLDSLLVSYNAGTASANGSVVLNTATSNTYTGANGTTWDAANAADWSNFDPGSASGGTVASGAIAQFADGTGTGTGAVALSLNSSRNIQGIQFSSATAGHNYTINNAGSGQITLDNTANHAAAMIADSSASGNANAVNVPLVLNSNLAVSVANAANQLTLGGNISETAVGSSLAKSGAGTLVLTGADTYTGPTVISAGTLQLGAGASGTSLSGSSTITDNGALVFDSASAMTQGTQFGSGAITGSGSLSQIGSGTTTLNVAESYKGTTSVSAGALTIASTGSIGNGGGAAVTVSGGALNDNATNGITGASSLTVTGGVATLAAANNYSGTVSGNGTTISGTGTVIAKNSGSLGASSVFVDSGAALNLNGTNASVNMANTLALTGSGVAASQTGALYSSAGSNSVSGSISLNGNTSIGANTGSTLALSALYSGTGSAIDLGNGASADYTLTLTGGGSVQLTGQLYDTNTAGALIVAMSSTGTTTIGGGASDSNANYYNGLTTVTSGELDLNKAAGINGYFGSATGFGNVVVNGGALVWLASDQVATTATLSVSSGTVNFNGQNQTLTDLTNSGGTILYGTGTVTFTDPTWSGGVNTVSGTTNAGSLAISGGTNTIQSGGTLDTGYQGGLGLSFSGTSSPSLAVNAGGALSLDAASQTGIDTTNLTTGTATISGTGSVTLNGANQTIKVANGATTLEIDPQIVDGGGSITKTGAGNLLLTGNSLTTYTGATAVNTGTLTVTGNIGGSAVTVANGATLAGTGTVGVATISGGGSIGLENGSIGTLTVGGLSSGSAGTPSSFTFDIGSTAGSIDTIADNGTLTLNGVGGTTITIGNAAGVTTLASGLYNLITYTGAYSGSLSDLTLSTTSLDGQTLTLVQGNGVIELQVGSLSVGAAYFNGLGNDLNTAGNYDSSASSSTANSFAPTSATNVFFSANRNASTTPNISAPLEVNSVNFGTGTGTNSGLTVSSTSTADALQIDATSANGNTVGSGITVVGGGADVISAPVVLGASQSWNTDTTSKLTVSGQVSGAYALTKSGTGTVIFSNPTGNIYTGGTTVNAGKLFVNNTSGSGTGSGFVTVNNGGTLGGKGFISTSAGVTINGGGSLVSGSRSQISGTALIPDGNGHQVGGMTFASTAVTVGSGFSSGTANLTFMLGSGTSGINGNPASGVYDFSNPNNNTTYLKLTGSSTINFAGTTSISLVDLTNTTGSNGSLSLRLSSPYLLAQAGSNVDYLNLVINSGTTANPIYSLSQNDATVNGWVVGVYNGSGGPSAADATPISIAQYGADGVTPLTPGSNGIYPAPALYLNGGDLEVVPEPSTWALMLGGIALLVVIQRRRNRVG